MIAAAHPQSRHTAKLLHIDALGHIRHLPRTALFDLLREGDVVVANDAATLPASLQGTHEASGAGIEVRLAGHTELQLSANAEFTAVVFGAGDYRARTEDRCRPPLLQVGDGLKLGALDAIVVRLLEHPRLVRLRFIASAAQLWRGLALHGQPIQYSHLAAPLALWDVWTVIAGPPVAYESPSAGFALDWRLVAQMRASGVLFVTLTHAAGISSTGDAALDAQLPFDEPYYIPPTTAAAINRARGRAQRVIAVGTTVVRALEHAGQSRVGQAGIVPAGSGVATQRVGEQSTLQIVDAVLSGTHESGSSHYELLRAFTTDQVLRCADNALLEGGYLTHEFGDSVLLERGNKVALARSWGLGRRCITSVQRDLRFVKV